MIKVLTQSHIIHLAVKIQDSSTSANFIQYNEKTHNL